MFFELNWFACPFSRGKSACRKHTQPAPCFVPEVNIRINFYKRLLKPNVISNAGVTWWQQAAISLAQSQGQQVVKDLCMLTRTWIYFHHRARYRALGLWSALWGLLAPVILVIESSDSDFLILLRIWQDFLFTSRTLDSDYLILLRIMKRLV